MIDWSQVITPEKKREQALDLVWAKIKSERDRRQNDGGFLVQGYWFHSDTKSRIQHLGLKDTAKDVLANGGSTEDPLLIDGKQIQWKLMDGTYIPMTVGLAIDVVDAAKLQEANLFHTAEVHWIQAQNSSDPGSYDYSSGWPTAFWERDT